MSDFDVVSYLAGHGIHGRLVSGGAELLTPCFFSCNEPANSRKLKLYCNIAEGWYRCVVCGDKGGTYKLQVHFGDNPSPDRDDHVNLALKRQCMEEATTVGQDMLLANDEAIEYLTTKRGLSIETIIERRLGWTGNEWSLIGCLPTQFTDAILKAAGLLSTNPKRRDYFHKHLLVPYIHHSSVTQLRGRMWPEDGSPGAKYLTPSGFQPDLYARDELVGATEVVLCEGEVDCISLAQALRESPEERLRTMAVVASPGVDAIKRDWSIYFEDVKRIYICFDPDEPGKRGAARVKELLGDRVRILELPADDTKADLNAWLLLGNTTDDFAQLIRAVDEAGRRVWSMAEAGTAWRRYKEQNPEGIKTGFRVLDSAIEPGLLPGQLMVVLAKTNTAKSIFLCNLAVNLVGRRFLFLTLEQTREEIYERLRRIYLFHHPHATDHVLEAAFSRLMICDENRISDVEFQSIVDEYEAEQGDKPEVLALDYLQYMARGQRGNSLYEKTTNAVMQLKAEAKASRMAIISPAQVNRGAEVGRPISLDDARESGAVEETADFLFSIYRPDAAAPPNGAPIAPTGKLRMDTLKSRHGGVGTNINLQMDLLTLAIVDSGTAAAARAQQHNEDMWSTRVSTWDELRRREIAAQRAPVQGVLA